MTEQRRYSNCPQCGYSAAPTKVFTMRKHFDAHALRCVRCFYTTETQADWLAAIRAWNRKAAAETAHRVAEGASAK